MNKTSDDETAVEMRECTATMIVDLLRDGTPRSSREIYAALQSAVDSRQEISESVYYLTVRKGILHKDTSDLDGTNARYYLPDHVQVKKATSYIDLVTDLMRDGLARTSKEVAVTLGLRPDRARRAIHALYKGGLVQPIRLSPSEHGASYVWNLTKGPPAEPSGETLRSEKVNMISLRMLFAIVATSAAQALTTDDTCELLIRTQELSRMERSMLSETFSNGPTKYATQDYRSARQHLLDHGFITKIARRGHTDIYACTPRGSIAHELIEAGL